MPTSAIHRGGHVLPAIGCARGFHPLETCACLAHTKNSQHAKTHVGYFGCVAVSE